MRKKSKLHTHMHSETEKKLQKKIPKRKKLNTDFLKVNAIPSVIMMTECNGYVFYVSFRWETVTTLRGITCFISVGTNQTWFSSQVAVQYICTLRQYQILVMRRTQDLQPPGGLLEVNKWPNKSASIACFYVIQSYWRPKAPYPQTTTISLNTLVTKMK